VNLMCDVCGAHVFFDVRTRVFFHARLTACTGIFAHVGDVRQQGV
jgi:hypothetical protein